MTVQGTDSKRLSSSSCAVAIVGAGPYGLSAASHLCHAGVEARLFGEPMEFWRKHMPRGMILRSRKRSSHIADPERAFTLDHYGKVRGGSLSNPSLAEYLEYAHWFQENAAAAEVDVRKVSRIDCAANSYSLTLQDGHVVEAERVVVAAGLFPFAWRPDPFDRLPASLVSHCSEHVDLSHFGGRRVLVVGAGQSALESAALLNESGAEVQIVARKPSILWLQEGMRRGRRSLGERMLPPTDVGGRITGWIAAAPGAYRRLPGRLRSTVGYRCTRPAGAHWLVPRFGDVPISMEHSVTSVEEMGAQVQVRIDDGAELVVDHVLLGTGYRIDVSRYPFLPDELVASLELVDGYPCLGPGLESSLPGLHFVGAPAAISFGPIMRFVVGTWYAAPALTRRILGKRERAFATSLPARTKARPER